MTKVLELHKAKYPDTPAQLHLISHSEGSVISFLALLEALDEPTTGPADPRHEWVRHVRSFMTIGSPIDKHLLLWPSIWPRQHTVADMPPCRSGLPPEAPARRWREAVPPIEWFNYYDLGDPIGFELDTAREYLKAHECAAFAFDKTHDIGFSRYLVPGKAHTGYWTDREVFRHFAYKAGLSPVKAAAPASHVLCHPASTAIPYAVSLALHLSAVYLMCKAVLVFLGAQWPAIETCKTVAALTLLLASVTVAGRLPRLVKHTDARWALLAALVFACGVTLGAFLLPSAPADYLARWAVAFIPKGWDVVPGNAGMLVFISGVLALLPWLVPRRPRLGRQAMVGGGAAVLAVAVFVGALNDNSFSEGKSALWPLLLSSLAFIYLWWLGVVLFDLAFIWQRYIRNTVALQVLRTWSRRTAEPAKQAQAKPSPMPGPSQPVA